MIKGIALVGPNGSGKTTLGKLLAERLGYTAMDIEDYYFEEADVPYSKPRTRETVQELISEDIRKNPRFIVSAVNGDLGPKVNACYDCIVYLQVPLNIRMKRIRQRAFDTFGSRILPGGDMYEQEENFFSFVQNRSMEKTDLWVKTMSCPVYYIDGTKPISEIAEKIQKLMGMEVQNAK